jgi:hypothetical protein
MHAAGDEAGQQQGCAEQRAGNPFVHGHHSGTRDA